MDLKEARELEEVLRKVFRKIQEAADRGVKSAYLDVTSLPKETIDKVVNILKDKGFTVVRYNITINYLVETALEVSGWAE
jgi:hypothetical protein